MEMGKASSKQKQKAYMDNKRARRGGAFPKKYRGKRS